jgi:hypothetical protein
MRKFTGRVFTVVLVVACFASSTFASSARELDRKIRGALQTLDGKATVHQVSLGRESLDTIELEPMQVWAKDAKIIAYGAGGEETIIPPPDVKYFKGRVVGEDESAVFISRSADRSIRGMILIGERRWVIGTGVRKDGRPVASVKTDRDGGSSAEDAPLLISEIDEADDIYDPDSLWECEVPEFSKSHVQARLSSLSASAPKKIRGEAGDLEGATYQLRIAIETDNEFCAAFGNNTTTLTTYIGDLIGKASTVYSRDVDTILVLGETHLRTGGPGTDPWTQNSTGAALAEFGTYWHNNYSLGHPDSDGNGPAVAGGGTAVARSSAVFLSGKLLSAGIAWLDVLCDDNFFCGTAGEFCGSATYANAYAGGYAFNTSSGSVNTTTPDPDATVNGVQYGIPSANFWMLLEVLHELGHNVASPHSSCVALSAEEKTEYGVTRNFVDQCLSGGSGCYSGSVSAPTEKGTIMSYCHNISSGGFRQSRFLLGKEGEASEKMLPIFKGSYNEEQPWFSTGLEGCTPDPTITVQSQPVTCAAGRTASVASCTGCTYEWSIDGGTITSVNNVALITYTPTDPEVTLTVTVIGERGCGTTASKTFTASCVAVLPPTNVVATATSTTNVQVSWTASAGAVSYNVYRSSGGGVYTLAGSPFVQTFNDTVLSNTAYLYKVRAVTGGESTDSNIDLATTVIFTDDPLAGGTTAIQAAHVAELRTAVNAVRTLAGLGAGIYTDPTSLVSGTAIKAVHVSDLRDALDAARSALALSAISYTDSPASAMAVKATHLTEVRNGVK